VRLIRVPAKLDVYDNGYPYQTVTVNKLTWRDAVDLHGPGTGRAVTTRPITTETR